MPFLSFKPVTRRLLPGMILAVLLAGYTLSLASMPARAHSADTTPENLSLNQDESFSPSPLKITVGAFVCPMDSWLASSGQSSSPSGGNVVVMDPNTTYDAGTITNLAASVDQGDPSLLPSGFGALLGAFIDSNGSGGCRSRLEITNTSPDTPFIISQIALVYTANSQPNTYHYNLIDLCSLPIQTKASICNKGRGGGGGIQTYTFKLGTGNANTVVSSQETEPLSISPNQTVYVDLYAAPANTSNPDYIYSIAPLLTLSTSQTPYKLNAASTIAFTDSSQVSCYQLQSNNTFLQMNDPSIPYPYNNVQSPINECV
jgi:hypothetical protein